MIVRHATSLHQRHKSSINQVYREFFKIFEFLVFSLYLVFILCYIIYLYQFDDYGECQTMIVISIYSMLQSLYIILNLCISLEDASSHAWSWYHIVCYSMDRTYSFLYGYLYSVAVLRDISECHHISSWCALSHHHDDHRQIPHEHLINYLVCCICVVSASSATQLQLSFNWSCFNVVRM